MMELAANAIKAHQLETDKIHNDPTTITFKGRYENQAPNLKRELMKIIQYTDVKPVIFDSGMAKGIAVRVVIDKNDGADNFCMRIFEVSASGSSPRHSHDWEHEIFIHSGSGEVYNNGKWSSVTAGSVLFIPGKEERQIRNAGKKLLVFACLVPSKAPEL